MDRIHNRFQWKGYVGKVVLSSLVAYVILLVISISLFIAIQLRTGATFSISIVVSSLILPQIVFGIIFASFFRGKGQTFKEPNERITDTQPTNYSRSRRDFLHLIIVSAVALPILYFGLNRLFSGQGQEQASVPSSQLLPQSQSKPVGFENPMLAPLLASELTPTYLFYRIDIDPIVPVVDAKTWNLNVKGLVNTPLTITYDEIRAMPSIDEYATLSCVSNKIGGDLISTALWKGIRLRDLLDKAKVKPEARYIVFRCSDGYDVGIPLERGLLDGTILAYDMNLAPLLSFESHSTRFVRDDESKVDYRDRAR